MKKYIEADELKLKVNHEMDMQDTYLPAHFFDIVDDMPAADVVEVRHGRWIHKDPSGTSCSKCGSLFPMFMGLYDYCPNCGASMQGEEE